MDTFRDNFGGLDPVADDAIFEDEDIGHEAPPPEIGRDERRMQVRAYNLWASLLDNDRNFPSVEDIEPATTSDFGPHGVLLDFSQGLDDPAITHLGARLAEECGAQGYHIKRLSDVPARSLLSRITDHYMQILANQAPIGFEAEFVNQRGRTILYRGILLPFSSDDETIDFVYGVINWKEMADRQSADELLLEIDQALESEQPVHERRREAEIADWADGPLSHNDDEDDDLPLPSFGMSELAREDENEPEHDDAIDPAGMALADWLAAARELARSATSSEERTRKALYAAIGRAYDFSLAAAGAPEEFAAMVEEAGLTMQDRAPMTPVVKLVFGADYDKTRLTEYATALGHAHRHGLGFGELAGHLANAEGGLKGVVQAERTQRKVESGQSVEDTARTPRKAIARKLRALPGQPVAGIAAEGEEFALVMIRRDADGQVVLLGEVGDDVALVEKAARAIIG